MLRPTIVCLAVAILLPSCASPQQSGQAGEAPLQTGSSLLPSPVPNGFYDANGVQARFYLSNTTQRFSLSSSGIDVRPADGFFVRTADGLSACEGTVTTAVLGAGRTKATLEGDLIGANPSESLCTVDVTVDGDRIVLTDRATRGTSTLARRKTNALQGFYTDPSTKSQIVIRSSDDAGLSLFLALNGSGVFDGSVAWNTATPLAGLPHEGVFQADVCQFGVFLLSATLDDKGDYALDVAETGGQRRPGLDCGQAAGHYIRE